MLRLARALPNVARFSSAPAAIRSFTEESLPTMRGRLLYQSKKRGILENDILLGGFAEEKLGVLDRPTLDAYDKLINGSHMEWDLFYYLSGKKAPPADVENCPAFLQLKEYVDAKRSPRAQ